MPHAPTSASFSVYSHGSRTGRVPVPKGSTAFQPTVHRPKENLLSGVVVMVVSFRMLVFSWRGLVLRRRWRCVSLCGGGCWCVPVPPVWSLGRCAPCSRRHNLFVVG